MAKTNSERNYFFAPFTFLAYTASYRHREMIFAMAPRTCSALQDGLPLHPPADQVRSKAQLGFQVVARDVLVACSFGIALGELSKSSVVQHSELETVTQLASDNSFDEHGCHLSHRRMSTCYYLPPLNFAGASSYRLSRSGLKRRYTLPYQISGSELTVLRARS
jgi:hypothetical protein